MNTKGKLLILSLVALGILQTSLASITYVDSPEGNWAYSTYSTYSGGINYYPTAMSEFGSATFVDYVTYGPEFRGQFRTNPSAALGFHIFSTWIVSGHDQNLFFINGGDDGHSVFVDGVFLGGGGFGVNVTGNIALEAGVARQLTVVTHNSGGEMHANIFTNLTPTEVIEDYSGITISAIPEPTSAFMMSLVLPLLFSRAYWMRASRVRC